MSIIMSILETILQEVEKHRILKVKSVKIRVGKLWQIIPDTLHFCYSVATEGTVAEGSEMLIVEEAIVAQCKQCGRRFEVKNYSFICSNCNLADAEIVAGDEMIIETIEAES